MRIEDLHVIMWRSGELNQEYNDALYKVTPADITVTCVYSNTRSSAAAIQLPDKLKSLYKEQGVPYIALCKTKTENWEDLGKLIGRGRAATDWVATGENTWYSSETKLAKKALFWVNVTAEKGIHSAERTE